jgi:hypothetical protein
MYNFGWGKKQKTNRAGGMNIEAWILALILILILKEQFVKVWTGFM